MKHTLVTFLIFSVGLAFAQSGDSLAVQKDSSFTRVSKYRVGVELGLTRKFGDWKSFKQPNLNYLLEDLKYSGVRGISFEYFLREKENKKLYIGAYFGNMKGQKTLPDGNFVDSLGTAYTADYQFKFNVNSLAATLTSVKSLGENLSMTSSARVGRSFFSSEEKDVTTTKSKGSNWLFGASLGLEARLSKRMTLGGQVSGWYSKIGVLQVVKDDGLEEVESEVQLDDLQQINLSRIDFTLAVKYQF